MNDTTREHNCWDKIPKEGTRRRTALPAYLKDPSLLSTQLCRHPRWTPKDEPRTLAVRNGDSHQFLISLTLPLAECAWWPAPMDVCWSTLITCRVRPAEDAGKPYFPPLTWRRSRCNYRKPSLIYTCILSLITERLASHAVNGLACF